MGPRVALAHEVAEAGVALHASVFAHPPPCPRPFRVCRGCTPDGRPAPDMPSALRGAVAPLSPEAHLRLRALRRILRDEPGPLVLVVAPDALLAWRPDIQAFDARHLGLPRPGIPHGPLDRWLARLRPQGPLPPVLLLPPSSRHAALDAGRILGEDACPPIALGPLALVQAGPLLVVCRQAPDGRLNPAAWRAWP